MNLREELTSILYSDDAYNEYENIDIDYCVNGILKQFEKFIDVLYTTGKMGNHSTEAYDAIKKEILR